MKKEIGETVILALSQDELEECIAGMKVVKDYFIKKIGNPLSRKKAERLFDTAITAMEMVWLTMQEEGKEQ